ncbi:MAG TPA: RidA family protein [bacterium (Candidatus Stahlbacteria)]|nr:RidA family protein [Candidatus Stahlbacteria bacterium]
MKETVKTDKAPAAIGPYAQAIKTNNLIFTAGQIAIDPETGKIIEGGIEVETERVILNIKSILEAAGSSLENVIKTTVYMDNLEEFTKMNGVYGKFFASNPPARSTVQAKLPKGVKIEIDAVAIIP